MGRLARLFLAFTFCLLPLTFFTACHRSAATSADEILKRFDGEWTVVSFEQDGQKSTAEEIKDISVRVENNVLTMAGTKGPKTEIKGPEGSIFSQVVHSSEYALQLDHGNSDGAIDFAHTRGDDLGKVRHGIFAV